MLTDIRLYISNKLVDFKTQPEILYNWQETDLSNPTITKNSFSKTIRVEGTKNNNDIFGHFWNVERNQTSGNNTGISFNPSYREPFELYVNGNIFEKGYVKLQNVVNDGGVLEYEIALFGGLGTFLYNLSTNYEDGTTKTLNSLQYDFPAGVNNFDFNINKEVVEEAWENINNPNSRWSMLNFVPAYTGIPDKLDGDKVLINFNQLLDSDTIPDTAKDGDGVKYSTYKGFALGSLDNKISGFEVKDIRSYLNVPVIKTKTVFDAICKPINSKGMNDSGYTVVLDNEFFNADNPYYMDTWMTLPKLNQLTYSFNNGDTILVRNYSIEEDTQKQNTYGNVYTTTTLRFDLPTIIDTSGIIGDLGFTLREEVTNPGMTRPTAARLDLQGTYEPDPNNPNEETRMQTAIATQMLCCDSAGTIISGSNVCFVSNQTMDGTRLSPSDCAYVPLYNIDTDYDYSYKNGYFDLVASGETSSLYQFTNTIQHEMELPIGTASIKLNIQRLPWNEGAYTNYGNQLFPFTDSEEYISGQPYWDIFNNLSTGSFIGSFASPEDTHFYSNKLVKQSELLTTDYSVAEWLMSYCKMFGLYIHKDVVEDKIYIDTRNTFYKRNIVLDIDNKIDYSKSFDINPLWITNKFYSLTAPIDKTVYSQRYGNDYGVTYGMKKINTGYEFEPSTKELLDKSKFKSGIPVNKQSLYFTKPLNGLPSYVYNGFAYNLYNGGNPTDGEYEVEVPKGYIQIKYVDNFYDGANPFFDSFYKMDFENDGKEIDCKNILLFYNGKRNVSECGYYLTDDMNVMNTLNNNPCWVLTNSETSKKGGDVAIKVNELPQFSIYRTDGNKMLYSTQFGSPRELYTLESELTNNDDATLYSVFYSDYLEDLFNVNTKVVTCYVKWNTMLNEDSLRKLYWFRNSLWRLNRIIDYSPIENRTVKCEFIKIHDVNSLRNGIPSTAFTFTVTLNQYTISYNGGTINGNVVMNDNTSWEYVGTTGGSSNVIVTPSSGNGSTSFTVTVPENTEYRDRTISLNFMASGITRRVEISQAAAPDNRYFVFTINNSSAYTSDYLSEQASSYTLNYQTNYANLTFVSNCVDWFNVTVNNGVLTYSLTSNYNYNDRTGVVKIYSGSKLVGMLTVTQVGFEPQPSFYYIFTANGESAYTHSNIAYNTSATAIYEVNTNYSNLTAVASDNWITATVALNGDVIVEFTPNQTYSARTATVSIYDVRIMVGELTLQQQAAPAPEPYFKFTPNQNTAYTQNIGSASTSSVTVAYTTNISNLTVSTADSWIGSPTLSGGSVVYSVTANSGDSARTGTITVKSGNTSVGVLTVVQAGIAKYFIFNQTGENNATVNFASSPSSSQELAYSTTYSNLTVSAASNWITATINSSGVQVQASNNTSINSRTGMIYVKSGNETVGTVYVNQSAATPYFKFTINNSSAYTPSTYSSASASSSFAYTTNYNNLSVENGISWITATLVNSNLNIVLTANSSLSARNGSVNVKSGNDTVGTLTVNQSGATPYFVFTANNSTAYTPSTYSSAGTSTSVAYSTNMQGLTASASTNWITGVTLSNGTLSYSINNNSAGSAARTGTITVKSGATSVGVLTLNQSSGAVITRMVTVEFPDILNVEISGIRPAQEGTQASIIIDGMSWVCDYLEDGMVEFVNSDIHQSEINVTTASTAYTFNFNFESDNGGSGSVNGQGWLSEINVGFVPEGGTGEQPFNVNIPAGQSTVTLYQLNPNVVITYQ